MHDPKSDPFFEQLKADVLKGLTSAERGPHVPFEEAIGNARAVIKPVAAERLAVGDDPAHGDEDEVANVTATSQAYADLAAIAE